MTPYYADDSVTLYHGDALKVLREMPNGSVNSCVTSPPYFGLRDYGEEGQYGLEASPAEYVETMRQVFAEVRRVLANDGTLWLNLGDSYSSEPPGKSEHSARSSTLSSGGHSPATAAMRESVRTAAVDRTKFLPRKNLMGMPWRVAFALQDDGWILRSDVIWRKLNFLPESVKDRPTRAHEYVFLFSKRQMYWYDAEAIREESSPDQVAHNERYAREYAVHTERAATTGQPGNVNNVGIHSRPGRPGRNARSVWSIAAQPFPESHFAVMPSELAERCIQAGCIPNGVVLDPFNGSGTTGFAAQKHGRRYVGIDLNSEYLHLSLRTRLRQATLDFGESS